MPVPTLDLSYLVEACAGDPVFIEELLRDYLKEMNAHLDQLSILIERADHRQIVREAHTIKGASANVGAQRIRDLAVHLETLARKELSEGSHTLLLILRQEMLRVEQQVEREGIEQLIAQSDAHNSLSPGL